MLERVVDPGAAPMIPPLYASATPELIAVNAVMAGCVPEAMPTVVAAIEALTDPAVNLYGMQATTHPCAAMVMVNGPEALRLGINSNAGVFGPGFAANMTIGRAVHLVLRNVGGARPGSTDRATQGSPAKIAFCFAENEADSPWAPFHVELGFDRSQSAVTVVAAEGPHNIENHASQEPRGLMLNIAHTIASLGKNNAYIHGSDYFLALGPEHARILADHGWTKRDVQQYVFMRARVPHRLWVQTGLTGIFPQPKYIEYADDELGIPMSDSQDDIHIVVAGGPGRHSSFIPTVAIGRSATREIRTRETP
jgi:hypothetical protein